LSAILEDNLLNYGFFVHLKTREMYIIL